MWKYTLSHYLLLRGVAYLTSLFCIVLMFVLFHRMFYESCDGIFVNYTWTEKSLELSRATAATDRDSLDRVFVGIDVFGRGCPGGGGYNSIEVSTTRRSLHRCIVCHYGDSLPTSVGIPVLLPSSSLLPTRGKQGTQGVLTREIPIYKCCSRALAQVTSRRVFYDSREASILIDSQNLATRAGNQGRGD